MHARRAQFDPILIFTPEEQWNAILQSGELMKMHDTVLNFHGVKSCEVQHIIRDKPIFASFKFNAHSNGAHLELKLNKNIMQKLWNV